MIVTINTPTGLDKAIAQLQSWLQAALFPTWGIDPLTEDPAGEFIFYPRVYRNNGPNGSGFIAELFTGGGNYREVYWDDAKKGICFFGIGSRLESFGDEKKIAVHLVTFANVKKLYPALAHRADNEIRTDFERVFQAPILGFTLTSTEIWLANVLREYPGSRREDRLLAADMGDVHAFRLNLELVFNSSQMC